eukprot:UN21311
MFVKGIWTVNWMVIQQILKVLETNIWRLLHNLMI